MRIIIAGDLVPTKQNIDLFYNGNIEELMGSELQSIWENADIRVFNLETPLVDRIDPIPKCGPNLFAPTKTVNGIKALNPSLVTLANNHIMDQGEQGLQSTLNILHKHDINFTGVGYNLSEASKPFIFRRDGFKIGVYSCAEHEFSIATKDGAGANPFDLLDSFDHIYELKSQCDYVIVLYHGGKEHYRYPSPYLQRVCRKMVLRGADLVICQHSHCVGCYEHYKNSTIIYGQGNFIFNKHDNEFWNNGLIINLDFRKGIDIKYVPIVKTNAGVCLADDNEAKFILGGFYKRSSEISNEEFVEKKYSDFSRKSIEMYLRSLTGTNKWISRLDRYLLNGYLLKRKCSKEYLLATQNYIECEAHREMIIQGMKVFREGK